MSLFPLLFFPLFLFFFSSTRHSFASMHIHCMYTKNTLLLSYTQFLYPFLPIPLCFFSSSSIVWLSLWFRLPATAASVDAVLLLFWLVSVLLLLLLVLLLKIAIQFHERKLYKCMGKKHICSYFQFR